MLPELALTLALTLPAVPPSFEVPPEPSRTALKWAITGYGVASAVDRATTVACLARGTCREVGAMRWANDHLVAFAATGAAVDIGIGWMLLRWGKDHPKAATWTALALTAVKCAVIARNSRTVARR